MKRTNLCPKCNSSDIVRIEGYAGAYGSGNNVALGMSVFSCVPVHRYVCCRCGFTEEWIDTGDLPKVKNSKKAIHL